MKITRKKLTKKNKYFFVHCINELCMMTNLLLPMEVTYKHFQQEEAEFMVLKKFCEIVVCLFLLLYSLLIVPITLVNKKKCDDILVQMCNIPILH